MEFERVVRNKGLSLCCFLDEQEDMIDRYCLGKGARCILRRTPEDYGQCAWSARSVTGLEDQNIATDPALPWQGGSGQALIRYVMEQYPRGKSTPPCSSAG